MTLVRRAPSGASVHRAYRRLTWTRRDAILVAALTIAMLGGMAFALPWIAEGWRIAFATLLDAMGMHADDVVRAGASLPFVPLSVEAPALPAPWPTTTQLIWGWGGTALAGAFTIWVYPRLLPAGVIIGFLTLVQVVAQAFFSLSNPPFPLALGNYLLGFQRWALLLLGLAPILLAATFYIFPVPLWRKVAVSVGLVAHLAVLIPLQGALLVWLVTHMSTLVLPIGSFVLGLPLDILVYVAFFSWGISNTQAAVQNKR